MEQNNSGNKKIQTEYGKLKSLGYIANRFYLKNSGHPISKKQIEELLANEEDYIVFEQNAILPAYQTKFQITFNKEDNTNRCYFFDMNSKIRYIDITEFNLEVDTRPISDEDFIEQI